MLIPLDEIKKFAKIDESYDDSVVSMLARSVSDLCAEYTGYSLDKSSRKTEYVPINANGEAMLSRVPNGMISVHVDGIKPFQALSRGRLVNISKYLPNAHFGYIRNPFCCEGSAEPPSHAKFVYETGFCEYEQIPGGILMGFFALVAWSYQHRGDEPVLRTENMTTGNDGGVIPASFAQRAVKISGAMDYWNPYIQLRV